MKELIPGKSKIGLHKLAFVMTLKVLAWHNARVEEKTTIASLVVYDTEFI